MNILSAAGSVMTSAVLLGADLFSTCIQLVAYFFVAIVDRCTGSGQGTARNKVPWHPQRFATQPVLMKGRSEYDGIGALDVAATLAASTFPISPGDLVARAQDVLRQEFGTRKGSDPDSLLSDDFQFVAPIVGPLSKHEFLAAFGSFKVKDAFPDIQDNSWFKVDPLEPNRVWFVSRATCTHTGTLHFGRAIAPTGKFVQSPPQAQSMLFNEEGLVYTLTVGYCMDKRIGNTEGLGGVFGLLKGIGKPFLSPRAATLQPFIANRSSKELPKLERPLALALLLVKARGRRGLERGERRCVYQLESVAACTAWACRRNGSPFANHLGCSYP